MGHYISTCDAELDRSSPCKREVLPCFAKRTTLRPVAFCHVTQDRNSPRGSLISERFTYPSNCASTDTRTEGPVRTHVRLKQNESAFADRRAERRERGDERERGGCSNRRQLRHITLSKLITVEICTCCNYSSTYHRILVVRHMSAKSGTVCTRRRGNAYSFSAVAIPNSRVITNRWLGATLVTRL